MSSRGASRQVLSFILVALAVSSSFASCTSSTEGGPGSNASPAFDASANDGAAVDAASPTPGTPDATSVDSGAESSGACSGGDPALVDGLTKAMGLWRWSKAISGASETPLDACDGSLHYRVGPEAFLPGTTAGSYAACVIAQGGIVPVSAGRLNQPTGCADIACTGSMGLVWSTAASGAVFELDANGKPKGGVVFRFALRPNPTGSDLIWSGASGIGGYVMTGPDVGNQATLSCQ